MAALDDLADRLDRAAEAMIELGPQLAAGEPWATAEQVGPGPESSWGPREVLAHVAEMLPYWLGEIELILDAAGRREPHAFGRLEDDAIRVAIITRDRAFPARELLGRVEAEAKRVARRLRALGEEDAVAIGRHVTRGDLSVRDIAERLIVGHIEGHVTQLRETVSATG
jgi:phosphatidylserine/phosphatidylglycerophosphate/cardiolipin synthase-like enzyme